MQGRIIKGIAGFYYVYAGDGRIYECKAKGVFRKDGRKILVGDTVEIDILDEDGCIGNIAKLNDRSSELIRPEAANVDQALIVFALAHPKPNYLLMDKLLLQYSAQGLPVILCFNKDDLVNDGEADRAVSMYKDCGSRIFVTCAKDNKGIDELKAALKGMLTCVAGPSGVGKSSLVNCLQDNVTAKTGDISRKLERGKHTTRHSEIIPISEDTFIMDTPGFSSFDVFIKDAEELKDHYNEFIPYTGCRFQPCSHTHEPDCAVKDAVDKGLISTERYNGYVQLYNELKNLRRY
ncbi:MAG: ribosome small subunit-dependent GTPase A [Lachnospiraceae bacterium]|nr:ribosome small subunit-dependent GTPase A [Lachnospiraceae bacterium]